jgi:hypothetical protein
MAIKTKNKNVEDGSYFLLHDVGQYSMLCWLMKFSLCPPLVHISRHKNQIRKVLQLFLCYGREISLRRTHCACTHACSVKSGWRVYTICLLLLRSRRLVLTRRRSVTGNMADNRVALMDCDRSCLSPLYHSGNLPYTTGINPLPLTFNNAVNCPQNAFMGFLWFS